MTKEILFLSWIPICDLVKWLDNVTMFIFKIISSPKSNFGLWRHTNRELDRNGTMFKHLSETLFMSKNQAGTSLNIFELNVFFNSYPNVGWFYSKRTASAPLTVLHSLCQFFCRIRVKILLVTKNNCFHWLRYEVNVLDLKEEKIVLFSPAASERPLPSLNSDVQSDSDEMIVLY